MMVVPVPTAGQFAGTPTKLFDGPTYVASPQRTYDVSRDAQRFLMIRDATATDAATPASLTVVLNWAEELKARLRPAQ